MSSLGCPAPSPPPSYRGSTRGTRAVVGLFQLIWPFPATLKEGCDPVREGGRFVLPFLKGGMPTGGNRYDLREERACTHNTHLVPSLVLFTPAASSWLASSAKRSAAEG